jgi:SAM-dependent methyltransferase
MVLETLSRLVMGQEPDEESRASVLPVLAELGMGTQTDTRFELGDFGHKCADAAREYGFWTGRQRRLHSESSIPAMLLGNFEGKRVLEIGPGWGCNLFRLQQVTPHARGREIDEVYVRLTPIFAKIEGVTAPIIDIGAGETLPYADGSFDWILMYSSLQYMDVKAAAREVARVLAPGGRLLSQQPTLSVLVSQLSESISRPRAFAHKSMTLLNSLAYGLFGRRLRQSVATRATSRPVYLTARQVISIVEDAGLQYLPALSGYHKRDFMIVAEKPSHLI